LSTKLIVAMQDAPARFTIWWMTEDEFLANGIEPARFDLAGDDGETPRSSQREGAVRPPP
jgi:hypothetical protein